MMPPSVLLTLLVILNTITLWRYQFYVDYTGRDLYLFGFDAETREKYLATLNREFKSYGDVHAGFGYYPVNGYDNVFNVWYNGKFNVLDFTYFDCGQCPSKWKMCLQTMHHYDIWRAVEQTTGVMMIPIVVVEIDGDRINAIGIHLGDVIKGEDDSRECYTPMFDGFANRSIFGDLPSCESLREKVIGVEPIKYFDFDDLDDDLDKEEELAKFRFI
jgi:hypothetical protein